MTKIFLKKRNYQAFVKLENKDKLSIELKDLEFSVRAINSLSNQGIKTLGELIVYTENDLKSFPNMGRTSIEEIKNILEDFSLYLGMNLEPINFEENNNTVEPENKEWTEVSKTLLLELIKDFNEIPLPLRAKNALLNLGCNYVGDIIMLNKSELFKIRALGYKSILEIEDYLINLNLDFGDQLDPWDKDIVIKLRDELREEVSETKKFELIDQDKLLEIELKRVLNEAIQISKKDISIKDRVIDVLNSRFGLDGTPAKTLEIIGQKYNVTRERIRQNESYGLRKLKFSNPITPILEKVFKILDQSLPITEIEFNRILKDKGLTNLEWDFKGLQDFYESFGLKQDFYISKINNIRVISKSSIDNVFREVMKNVKKKISNSGLMSLSNCMSFREIYLNNIKRDTVKNFIQTMPVFYWLDSEENWFTFYSNRNRLSNLVSKAATALQKQNIDDLFKKIKKYHRLEEVLYSKEVFKNFCQICFDANLNEDEINFISSKSKLSNYEGYQGKIVAPNEQKIIDIFNDYGPILNWWDLKELIKKNNVSEASFIMIMQYSVFFKRIDRATYTLSNQKIDFKNINNFKIDLSNESYSVQETEILKNQIAYIDVYDFGEFKLTMDYPRPLRRVMKDYKGVSFENQVYIVS
ncbi:DNA-directed RNA polymerase subunit alpha C-terminal domain-containing protein [Candidatus Pelagibacter sp. HIMB1521]|uniref:DNA-directed RNA polymerase subunit alpha C-terminal domain-containing protein n=1 Tax=Candidatus Pelagibacter sp. HIMB1521 TaxID=3413344 RepID=UPI003F86F808